MQEYEFKTDIITFIVPWLLAATTTLDPCFTQHKMKETL